MERKVNLMGMNMIIWGEAMMQEEYGRVIMWLVFIVCLMVIEIITKVIQEYNNQNLHLAIVRTELLKKFALVMVLIALIPLPILLADVFSVNAIISVYLLETINELLSILKNLNKLGITTDIFDPIIKRLTNKNE